MSALVSGKSPAPGAGSRPAIRIAKTVWLDWHHPLAFQPLHVASRSVLTIGFIAFLVLRLRSAGAGLVVVLTVGLLLASAFTVAEARNGVLMDVPQLLAVALLADKRVVGQPEGG